MSESTTTKTTQATATEMARIYLLRHYTDTIFTMGQWHKYQHGVWNKIHDLAIDKEIWELLEEFEGKGRCRPGISNFNSTIHYIRSKLYVEETEMDQVPNLINLQNGVFNLDDSTCSEHKESYYFTTQLPFAYDPHATCDMWNYFLRTSLVWPETFKEDIQLMEFMQEAIGYSLTSDISQHATFWCYGGGNNGKGVLFHVLEKLAGKAFFPLNIKLMSHNPYQLAELGGKRIAGCSESNATDNLVDDAQIKALVAGDTMSARSPHQRPFDLHPHVKLWWSMNALPAVADFSEGFWRRVRVIPFNREFQPNEQITDLKERLNNELPGIFNWAMEGLRRLQSRGRFAVPQQVKDVTSQYRHEANPISLYIDDECIAETDLARCTQVSEIYRVYKEWCLTNTYRAVASRRFRHEMLRLGYPVRQKNAPVDKTQVFFGIRSKNSLF